MKHIKQFEGIWTKNLIVGNIYVIDRIFIARPGKHNLPYGKITKIHDGNYYVEMKTYIEGTYEDYTFEILERQFIKRRANKEEIAEFYGYETLQKALKYNL